ncbi:MAG: PKD-like family lipoprotein [Carboxylicivirga sp.]|nr:PKD-like family lipoprotein [Carboxylicivirga sp.]
MKYIYIIVIGFLLVQCSTDQEDAFIAEELQEVQIEGLETTYTVKVLEDFEIDPEIITSDGITDNLSYLWYIYKTTSAYTVDTLGTEKKLKTSLTGTPGMYVLNCKVTNDLTGVFTLFKTDLELVNSFTKGLLVLGENNDEANLNFIDVAGITYKNIYSQINSESLGTNPKFINWSGVYNTENNQVLILTDDSRGGVMLNALSMIKLKDYKDSFILPVDNIAPQGVIGTSKDDYVINDGKIHKRSHYNLSKGNDLFGYHIIGDGEISPVGILNATPLFYESENKRFVGINRSSYGPISVPSGYEPVFDANNVGLDLIAGAIANNDVSYGLFKDDDNNYYSLGVRCYQKPRKPMYIEPFAKVQITSLMDLDKATCFTSGTIASGYLFYAVGSKLYAFNFATNVGALLYEFDNNAEVDCLKIYRETGDDGFVDHLYVGYRDNTKTTNGAGVKDMKLSFDGGLNVTLLADFPGVCDKIVSLVYQNNL